MPKKEKATSVEARIKQAESEFLECQAETKTVQSNNGITWDQKEALFFGKYVSVDKDGVVTVNKGSTGELTTLAIDRAARVMAQMPTGRFENYSEDTGKNILMNILWEHYVIPYARNGGPMKMRLRMVDLYADLYTIPVLVEMFDNGLYSGPDFTLLDPRRWFPQAGKAAVEDMDYCFVETFPSKAWIEDLDEEHFKNKAKILDSCVEEEIDNGSRSYYDRSSKMKGIRVRHKLSRNGDWLAYLPGKENLVLIDQKGYFPRIPIVLRQQYPRIGSVWSYTNFERGYSTQEKIDRLNELGVRAFEMMIDPPAILDPASVIMSSFKRQRGANWLVKDGKVGDIKFATVAPQALAGYQAQFQVLKANLLSMGADTDTAVTKNTDPGFGRSPEALKQQGARQGSRDSWDMDMQQQFIEDLFSLMADLVASKGIDKYSFNILSGAIKQIKEDFPEEADEIDSFLREGKMEIPVDRVAGKYRYIMEPGSTLMKKEDVAGPILSSLKLYIENPAIKEDLAENKQKFDTGVAFKAIMKETGSKYADKIITTLKDPASVEGVGSDGSTVETPVKGEPPIMPPEIAAAVAAANGA